MKPAVRRNARTKDGGYDIDEIDQEIIEKCVVPEQDSARKVFIPSNEEASGNDDDAFSEEVYQDVEGQEELYEGTGNDQFFEVVIKREEEQLEQHEVPVEYVEVDGVEQDFVLSPDHQELIVDEQDSDPESNLDESYSPHSSSESDISFELNSNVLVVSAKPRKRSLEKPIDDSSQRFVASYWW